MQQLLDLTKMQYRLTERISEYVYESQYRACRDV